MVATVLTLIVTPSFLALRVWFWTYAVGLFRLIARITGGRRSRIARDWAVRKAARQLKAPEIIWDDLSEPAEVQYASDQGYPQMTTRTPLRAAE